MTNRIRLTDEEWHHIYNTLTGIKSIRVKDESGTRLFLDAVLWILRTGSQWRHLPKEFGHWNSVFMRFSRWCKNSIWNIIFETEAQYADLQEVSIDSTVNRAHACAAGMKGSNEQSEALGRSKGGFSTKVHAVSDALGLPIKFILTPGQNSDISQAENLIQNVDADALLGDKGYDSNNLIGHLDEREIKAVIPPKSNRKEPRHCDFYQYKERHVVECMFGKLKHYRRIATRYDKKATNYMGFIEFCSALLWLR